jgi:hypothetical protein
MATVTEEVITVSSGNAGVMVWTCNVPKDSCVEGLDGDWFMRALTSSVD